MRQKAFSYANLALAVVLVLGLLAAGCGTGRQSPQTPPTATEATSAEQPAGAKATEAAPAQPAEPTATPVQQPAEPTPTVSAEEVAEDIDDALDNLVKLAPLHLVSSMEYKAGDSEVQKARFEGDVDANGNQHMFLYAGDAEPVELYIVGGKMYIGSGGGQFLAMGEAPEGSTFAFAAMYGGAYLLAYNELRGAKRLGSESVNGFDCDKYQIQYDLSTAGISGAVAEAQGVEWEYEAFAWIEKSTKAIVRARVDWKGKSSEDAEASTFHSEFDVTRGTVKEIKAPENVMSISR